MTQAIPKSSPVSRRKLWAWRIVRAVLLVYLGVMLVISMLQELLIFPGHSSQGQKYAQITPSADSELVPLDTSNGDRIFVLFGKAMNADGSIRDDTSRAPTIIMFYGNAMTLSDIIGLCRSWRKLGANVIGVEFPGYGMSSGKPGEQSFYAAADAAWEYLAKRPDIDPSKIIPAGLSIGTGVAVELAARKPAAGLILLAPFTRMIDLAHDVLPWLPISTFLRHHFDNQSKMADLKMPILIVHGNHDSIIPTDMSRRLASAATRAQVTSVFLDSDHNDLLEKGHEQIDAEVGKLIRSFQPAR
ncbi:MAG TPA: alpha/beta hydrolase [Tepidisphaeraceae bacterium]|nr:alpha/beta hydrolase [Tepidisphaeraceae bacterium]